MPARELESTAPLHLHPTAPLAERVLLPGDPGRALMLAQLLLAAPKMFNHNRGLWGYTGTAADGEDLTIQSTGMGGPSAAIVLHELVALGARRAIRVGTCGALLATLELGELVVASEAICADGTSRAIGAGDRASADPGLSAALLGSAPATVSGAVVSVDLFYENPARTREHDAIAVEMEAASLFALGATLRVAVGCMLCVSDTFAEDGERTHIDAGTLRGSVDRMGAHALAALRR